MDSVLGPPASGWEGGERIASRDSHVARGGDARRARRHLLLPALRAVQSRAGWISPGALNYVCERLDVAPADAYGVASFYALLSVERQPATIVHVCEDLACRLAGASRLAERLAGTWPRGTVRPAPCLGQCERAPAALVQKSGPDAAEYAVAPASLPLSPAPEGPAAAPRSGSPSAPQTLDSRRDALRLLRRVGRIDPESLEDYRAHGGYRALTKAIERTPAGVVREALASRLQGRGGAAFPAGRKWEAVAKAPERPHYLVCNADESEPGTFKDRVLLEEDPFAIVEAMTIVGFATGCETGFLYVRGEYPLAFARFSRAVASAREAGLLGERVLGAAIRFDIEVRRGAGAYICGEETALFNSIEGFRGEPRNKPPFPVEKGLFGKPTVVNNVETLACVPDLVLDGGEAFARIGTAQSTGPKLFCLSGAVARPGVYEVAFGATLRELLALAGGVPSGRSLRAVLLGGAAGTFLAPSELDVPLTFEGTRAIGASLGSGVVMAFDDRADLADAVARIAAFFRDESCGQCVPCRVGTERQEELVARLAAGRPLASRETELTLLDEMAQAMRDASICGLGQTASGAIQSAIRKLGVFPA